MRYVSIDIETTGLDPNNCDMIEFGAVIDSIGNKTPITELPKFHTYIDRKSYSGEPFALSMHPGIFKRIATKELGYTYTPPEMLGLAFGTFLETNGYKKDKNGQFSITCAGKNFASFDYRFLLEMPYFMDTIRVSHRIIDPVMLYFDPLTMEQLPNLSQCLKAIGLDGVVRHRSVEDAQDVVRLLRAKWNQSPATIS